METCDVIDRIRGSLKYKEPFSLVRIGDGENIVLSQNSVWSIEDVLKERWAINSNKGTKGVTLPNLELRDSMVEAIKKADVVGILPEDDKMIKVSDRLKWELTNQIFSYYEIMPVQRCHACINRLLVQEPEFWIILRGRKILLIYKSPSKENHPGHTV